MSIFVADNKSKLITRNQSVKDIVGWLMVAQHKSNADLPKIRALVYDPNIEKCLNNIFDWMKEALTYVKESPENQTVKSVSRIIVDGYGDCKHFTTLAIAGMRACDIPCFYRIAGYKYDNRLTHIYAVADLQPLFIMDGVLKFPDEEAPFIRKVDVKLK